MGILESKETGVESKKHSVMEMPTTHLPNQTFLCSERWPSGGISQGGTHSAMVQSPPQMELHSFLFIQQTLPQRLRLLYTANPDPRMCSENETGWTPGQRI